MAQGAARSFDRSGDVAGGQGSNVVRLVPGGDGQWHAAIPLAAPPARPKPALSPSPDLLGIRRSAWLGAGAFYSGTILLLLVLELPVSSPEPWPEDQAMFQMVFLSPPVALPTEVESEAPALPASLDPQPAVTAPDSVSEMTVASAIAPPPQPEPTPGTDSSSMPPPPPRKPPVAQTPSKALPGAATTASSAPPSANAAPAVSQTPVSAQVAVLPPPAIEQPLIPPHPVGAAAGNAKPDYPAEARRRGQQGRVVLRVEVSAAGSPVSVTIGTSSGHELLDQAALRAVSGWRFTPATRGAAPVAGAVDLPVQFRLED
jgi:protein TonB